MEDERRKRQQLIIEQRKREQESRTKTLLEQQRKTVIKEETSNKKVNDNHESSNELKNKKTDNGVSFNSVLEADSIPIIKNNKLMPEKVGVDSAIKIKEEVSGRDLFPNQENIFPTLKSDKE